MHIFCHACRIVTIALPNGLLPAQKGASSEIPLSIRFKVARECRMSPQLRFAARTIVSAVAFLLILIHISLAQDLPPKDQWVELDSQTLFQKLESTQGEARTALQLQLLDRRLEKEERNDLIAAMLEEYGPKDDPAGMGLALMHQMIIHMHAREPEKALELYDRVIAYGERCQTSFPEVRFDATVHKARITMEAGEYLTAISLANEALRFGKPFGTRLRINRPLRILSFIASRQGFVDKSIEYLQQELQFALDKRSELDQLAVLESIGTKLINTDRFDEAAKWFDDATDILTRHPDRRLDIIVNTRKSIIGLNTGRVEEALSRLREVAARDLSVLRYDEVSIVYDALANAERVAGNFDTAIEIIENTLTEHPGQPLDNTLLELQRVECWIGKQQYSLAIQTLQDLEEQLPVLSQKNIRRLALLSECHAAMANHEEAYKALAKCRQVSIDASTEDSRQQIAFASALLENQQQAFALKEAKDAHRISQAELAQRSAEAEMHALTASRAASSRNYILVLGTISLLCTGAFAWIWSGHRIQTQLRKLNRSLETELDRRYQELVSEADDKRRLELELERKMRHESIGKIAAGVAHDFNNLLTVIQVTNALMESESGSLSTGSQQLLDSSNQAIETAAKIVQQLVAYAGKSLLREQPFEVGKWLEANRMLFHTTVGDRTEFKIENTISEPVYVCLDQAQLTSAVLNLLCNAREAVVESSGHVVVRIEKVDPGQQDPDIGTACIKVAVLDDGCGMTDEQRRRACEPFFRGRDSHRGSGLGLSTVFGWVQQSHGEMTIESQVGAGTKVALSFPISPSKPAPQKSADSEPEPPSAGSLLLVEDEDTLRPVLVMLARRLGYQVQEAANADEAIRILRSGYSPSAVLSDISMPGSMNGIELRKWVLQNYPDLPVILMSGYSAESEPSEGQRLSKPFSVNELARALTSARKLSSP